ncbi:Pentatricopeptide repeat-containing protein [Colletotrichum trifolii]|uniref:Pentatricopeptide repeat-containing protein n=1 Tax=Colletotrichum trifolii TaxID=5466 RepID=A0A4V3HTS8_COLTR|nr:Pentatricopeptide repeat-containing protein [Colletotrichum trifolii]
MRQTLRLYSTHEAIDDDASETRRIVVEHTSKNAARKLKRYRASADEAIKNRKNRTSAYEAQTSDNKIQSREDFLKGIKDASVSVSDAAEVEKKKAKQLQWVVDRHLQYSKDVWKIGKEVEGFLAKDRFDAALLLAQRTSKTEKCVVAWNHLIKYQAEAKGSLKTALKLLNDMKKRGQSPNEQTYTIIFSACTETRSPTASQTAVKMYRSLLTSQAIKPNLIHMNAVLNACGRPGDIEAMFSIAETADAREGRRADATTYTILLDCMRGQVIRSRRAVRYEDRPAAGESRRSNEGSTPVAEQARRELRTRHSEDGGSHTGQLEPEVRQAIDRSKALWEEVLREWRAGKLRLDERLVCAMGRMLLLGDTKERAYIFTILNETMSIADYTKEGSLATESTAIQNANTGMRGIAATADKAPKQAPGSNGSVVFAIPGRRTLSLVLDAICADPSSPRAKLAGQYWHLFTNHFDLKPDAGNYDRMIKLREQTAGSASISRLIYTMPKELMTPLITRGGFQACLRDNKNPGVFANARSILDSMLAAPSSNGAASVDVVSLILFLRVARLANYTFRQMAAKGQNESADQSYGAQLATAVQALKKPFQTAKEYLARLRHTKGPGVNEYQGDLLDLARDIVRTVDMISERRLVADKTTLTELHKIRQMANRMAVMYTDPQQKARHTADE